MHLWIPGHSGIQGSQDEDAMARNGSFLRPESVTQISQCIDRLKIKMWLTKMLPKYWAAALGVR
jgi:hypothetical protein